MSKQVDSYRFISSLTRRVVRSWIKQAPPVMEIPWTPPAKPLSASRVALISTAGIALKGDTPFDQEGERNNPWWGDPSFRIIPGTATEEDVEIYHLHIDPRFAQQDLNCILPLQRLHEMAASGEIGSVAGSHYSFMGYILQPQTLLQETAPAIVDHLLEDGVDVVLLVPV